MIIKNAETQQERAKRLYQVGHVIDSYGSLYLVTSVTDGYALYGLGNGWQTSPTYTNLPDLIKNCYHQCDKLVTALTYETED